MHTPSIGKHLKEWRPHKISILTKNILAQTQVEYNATLEPVPGYF